MSMGFSAAVKLGDLDDYLKPMNDCVVLPSSGSAKPASASTKKSSLIKSVDNVASVSLSDCLACSGCVTSAETVLLQSHSADQLLKEATDGRRKIFFVSLSSASRRALAKTYQKDPSEICEFVTDRLRIVLGSDVVVTDTSLSEAIVLDATLKELSVRKEKSQNLPLLTSHCPGWSCYATKVLDESVMALLSTVKSAEQIQGTIVKYFIPLWINRGLGQFDGLASLCALPLRRIRHVYISPCFDKKLEVIRPDYVTVPFGHRAVDLVLATSELVTLLDGPEVPDTGTAKSIDHAMQIFCRSIGLCDSWAPDSDNSLSGGYAQATAMADAAPVQWNSGKNSDLLTSLSNVVRSYGFRNIQNVVRNLTHAKFANAKFFEIMACPGGGCPKGGGQPVEKRMEVAKEADSKWSLGYLFSNIISRLGRHPDVSRSVNSIDYNSVEHVSQPQQYKPAMAVRDAMVSRFNGSTKWMHTEWKSLAEIDPETGTKRTMQADLKW